MAKVEKTKPRGGLAAQAAEPAPTAQKKEPESVAAPAPATTGNVLSKRGAIVLDITNVSPVDQKWDLELPPPEGVSARRWAKSPGDKIIYQMLLAGKYTVAQICATVIAACKGSDEEWDLEAAHYWCMENMRRLKKLGLKPEVKT